MTSKIVTLMALGALTAAACDGESGPDAPEQAGGIAAAAEDEVREIRAEADADAVLDEIVVAEGASVRFIDERASVADGGVGMLAHGIPRFAEAVRALELTPLELYLTLAPGEEAPERLWEDHDAVAELQGRASRAPRAFRLEERGAGPGGGHLRRAGSRAAVHDDERYAPHHRDLLPVGRGFLPGHRRQPGRVRLV
ncbi:hypothetical protein [Nannocystis pusilla]|uniref:hypothetical protein n=1 Tax=Nannocystis pusilla TaxID=889268 RepID=UPI003DA27DEE